METKRCTVCGRELPATTEYFTKRSDRPCGITPDCKNCRRRKTAAYRVLHPYERTTEVLPEGMKRCPRCREVLPFDAFYGRHDRGGKPAAYCKLCRSAYAVKRRSADPETHRDYELRYRRAHPDVDRAKRDRRRTAEGSYTASDIESQRKRQRGRCYWCGERVGGSYHVDHVVPIARGGTNDPSNLVIACPTCNLRKRDKLPHEFCGHLL